MELVESKCDVCGIRRHGRWVNMWSTHSEAETVYFLKFLNDSIK